MYHCCHGPPPLRQYSPVVVAARYRCRRRGSLDTGFTPRAAVSARRSPRMGPRCAHLSTRTALSAHQYPFPPGLVIRVALPWRTTNSPLALAHGQWAHFPLPGRRECAPSTVLYMYLKQQERYPADTSRLDRGFRIQDSGSAQLCIPDPPPNPPEVQGPGLLPLSMYAGASVRRIQITADEPQLPFGQTLRYVRGSSAASSFPTADMEARCYRRTPATLHMLHMLSTKILQNIWDLAP